MGDTVRLRQGEIIPLMPLRHQVPHAAFQGELHADVCERIAALRSLSPENHRTYVNLLFKRSDHAKAITALVQLTRAGHLDPVEVRSRFASAGFADLLEGRVAFSSNVAQPGAAIGVAHLGRFATKVFAHWVFRLLGRGGLHSRSVIRAWVDSTDAAYPREVESAAMLIYPYAISARRQLRYLWHCRKQRRYMSLMGLPFRARDVLRVFLDRRDWEVRIVECERRAFLDHASDIEAMGAEVVYTTDEFEAAACEFHQELERRGIRTVNRSHGVAVYGPYIFYSEFWFLNRSQRSFYLRRGRVSDCRYLRVLPESLTFPVPHEDAYRPGVVYLQGNWAHATKRYEAAFERDAIRAAQAACDKLGLPFVVKLHPNCGRLGRRGLNPRAGIKTVKDMDSVQISHPIFLSIGSSAIYTYLERGPVQLLVDDLSHPKESFWRDIDGLRPEELADLLEGLRTPAAWSNQHRRQVESLRHEAREFDENQSRAH